MKTLLKKSGFWLCLNFCFTVAVVATDFTAHRTLWLILISINSPIGLTALVLAIRDWIRARRRLKKAQADLDIAQAVHHSLMVRLREARLKSLEFRRN